MFYQVDKNNLILFVYLIPKSSVDKIIGIECKDGEKQYLIIRLRSVPEDGKANKALIKFLAKQWKIPSSSIFLKSGATSRYKQLYFSTHLEELKQKWQSFKDCIS
ncbi:DUF167 domain-containing protein [Bartonella krasnovii]|uniref:UPF0235 protein MNL13_00260 n=1 Tax=Bartonella krasnovii TaxID=2267275 RepID=A0ABY3VZQ4_9HYPH|nr:DUF167 domain-containing protein [Bartonella krasnovii]UNF29257.1 DUF167 domain-containing protein [Bartonella krasnovii]UNF35614.1 DUF167 domain-containing protein [Bartonella krasnovii]UNF38928.1 DUF167 domain-containing protein [Bartonella krasnovii]UNF43976.1 DUF167 domain-containing protein [Bartonella krasnovii]UNF47164.1 DUF167 domain-containing protein [Bartonella krasnovii]